MSSDVLSYKVHQSTLHMKNPKWINFWADIRLKGLEKTYRWSLMTDDPIGNQLKRQLISIRKTLGIKNVSLCHSDELFWMSDSMSFYGKLYWQCSLCSKKSPSSAMFRRHTSTRNNVEYLFREKRRISALLRLRLAWRHYVTGDRRSNSVFCS